MVPDSVNPQITSQIRSHESDVPDSVGHERSPRLTWDDTEPVLTHPTSGLTGGPRPTPKRTGRTQPGRTPGNLSDIPGQTGLEPSTTEPDIVSTIGLVPSTGPTNFRKFSRVSDLRQHPTDGTVPDPGVLTEPGVHDVLWSSQQRPAHTADGEAIGS